MGMIFLELLVPFQTEMERHHVLSNARRQIFPLEFKNKYSQEVILLFFIFN